MINMIYILFLGCWRRWFGGGFDALGDNRFLQHVIGFLCCASVLYLNHYLPFQSLCVALCLQGLFWARSHGCCFDLGRQIPSDESRYEQLWYWKYLKKYIPNVALYGFGCDYIVMLIRYTGPAVLISLILMKPSFAFAGIVLTNIYAVCWYLYDWGYIKKPTEWAEILVGFSTAILLLV